MAAAEEADCQSPSTMLTLRQRGAAATATLKPAALGSSIRSTSARMAGATPRPVEAERSLCEAASAQTQGETVAGSLAALSHSAGRVTSLPSLPSVLK